MQFIEQLKRKSAFLAEAAVLMVLFVCVPGTVLADQYAVMSTVAGDYSSGAHSVVSVGPVGGLRSVSNNLVPSGSDITVVGYGQYFYRMERSNAHNITKFDIGASSTPIWQFSTEGTDSGSNPHDLIFANDEKAYLLRYGTDTIWIVDPTATTEADFKLGELDLGAYADFDGIPEMQGGIIIDSRLFIILQRLDRDNFWSPTNTSYVVVVDTVSDSVIQQIDLPVPNPQGIQYLEDDQTIYIACSGGYFDASSNGGIVTVDPTSYQANLLLDGDAYSGISGLAMISATKGYFIGYGSWGNNTLYSFDPSAAVPTGAAVAGFGGLNLSGMENGVSLDENGMLWICNQTDGQVDILNPATDIVDESVSTDLNPSKVAFASTPDPVVLPPDGGDDDDDLFNCFINTLR